MLFRLIIGCLLGVMCLLLNGFNLNFAHTNYALA